MFKTQILGTGAYQPANAIPNQSLSNFVDTDDAWIRARSGIEERRFAHPGETNVSMGAAAAAQAIERSGLAPTDIDMVIVATSTPDTNFPAMAAYIQRQLGLKPGGVAFDVNSACAGFMPAYITAEALLGRGLAKNALVIGSERMSALLDMSDRTTMVLFGDGAGAVVLSASDEPHYQPGLLASTLSTEGALTDILETRPRPDGISRHDAIYMKGKEVFRHAVEKMTAACREVVDLAQVSVSDVTWVIPHQANLRIVKAVTEKLGFPEERVVKTVQKQANTSAASIPLAIDTAIKDGRLQRGDLMIMVALGAGISWGGALIRY